ncbi:hypothetical protein SDC9_27708 [bioreactor metagenome]|jgi:hypothetical protein|uniref:Uncharacterized protein n=1 Tax=bioreactor metagenome TaxID=1076179 RepID=A0A644URU9_9ZZZZ
MPEILNEQVLISLQTGVESEIDYIQRIDEIINFLIKLI